MADDDEDDYLKEALEAARRADEERAAAAAAAGIKRRRSGVPVPPPAPVSAKARLISGLATAISSDNKGFALLQKAGWTPGTGAGPQGKGRAEPVPVGLRRPENRAGIGGRDPREEHVDELAHGGLGLGLGAAPAASASAPPPTQEDDADWAAARAQRNASVSAQRALAAACRQLRALAAARADREAEAAGAAPPQLSRAPIADGDVLVDKLAFSVDDVLGDPTGGVANAALSRARAAASAAASSAMPLFVLRAQDSSPAQASVTAAATSSTLGSDSVEHRAASQEGAATLCTAATFVDASLPVRLSLVIARMREAFTYCLHCGEQFADDAAMAASCPGPDASDHE